jgi:hypothetical protein
MARWSTDRVQRMTVATASAPPVTTGCSLAAPTARMPDCAACRGRACRRRRGAPGDQAALGRDREAKWPARLPALASASSAVRVAGGLHRLPGRPRAGLIPRPGVRPTGGPAPPGALSGDLGAPGGSPPRRRGLPRDRGRAGLPPRAGCIERLAWREMSSRRAISRVPAKCRRIGNDRRL